MKPKSFIVGALAGSSATMMALGLMETASVVRAADLGVFVNAIVFIVLASILFVWLGDEK